MRDRNSRGREDDSRDRPRDRDDRGSDRGRDRDRDDRGGSRRGGSRFEYKARDAGNLKKRSEQGGKDFDTYIIDEVDLYKVQDGANFVRVLPPTWDEPEHYGLDIYVHYEVGPDKQTYLCLNKMKGEKCPVCEERAQTQKDGDDEYAKKLEPKKRVLTYMIDRNNEKDGIKAWPMPWTLDRDIVKVSVDKRSGEVFNVDDPHDGYDVEFERTGKGARTEYTAVAIARRSSPLDNDDAVAFAVEHPLPSILKYYSYDHIAATFGGGSAPANDREDSRDRDRDKRHTGGRGDDRDHGSDRGSDRSGGRDRDSDRGSRDPGRDDRRTSSRSEPEYSWETVHEMNYDELCALVDDQKLDIDPDKSKDDEDLADWICEEMKLKKEERKSSRDEGDGRSRLSSMREGRER